MFTLVFIACGSVLIRAAQASALESVQTVCAVDPGSVDDHTSAYQFRAWNPPSGTGASDEFAVRARKSGSENWTDLFVFSVKVGHQDGTRYDTSMVVFDFSGAVDIRVSYLKGDITSHEMRPTSHVMEVAASGDELRFSLTQDTKYPRKVVLRVNDGWEEGCLHILTNRPEEDAPASSNANVYVINPGDDVPLQLPVGKDTYYFAPGAHTLPKGLWVEADLGDAYSIDRMGLSAGPLWGGDPKWLYPQRFILETKLNPEDKYSVAYDGLENTRADCFTQAFPEIKARYVRLRLVGGNTPSGYIFSNVIRSFEIYEKGGAVDLVRNRALAGAMPGYKNAVDGDPQTLYATERQYGNWHSGESFFLSKDNYTIYIAPGAVVKGSILSDEVNNITIRGRGILDCGELTHYPLSLYEARAGAVWLISGANNMVEGVTILDPPMWGVVMNFSTSPMGRDINLIGSVVNADGIHMSGCVNGAVEGAFIRSCDDGFVAYHYGPTRNITVSGCVFWQDDARNILLGMGNTPDSPIENIMFKNIDILGQRGVYVVDRYTGVFQLWAHAGNTIRDISFRNIRIDKFKEPEKSAIFQCRTDPIDPGNPDDKPGKLITDIRLENIAYLGCGEQQSLIEGTSEDSRIGPIQIRNYTRQGLAVVDKQSANIHIGGFAQEPVFLDSKIAR